MIGGTAWKITKDEEEHFVYAVDVNHKNEYHLDGFQIDRITKPNLLITDGFNANYAHKRKKDRDEQLCQARFRRFFTTVASIWLLFRPILTYKLFVEVKNEPKTGYYENHWLWRQRTDSMWH